MKEFMDNLGEKVNDVVKTIGEKTEKLSSKTQDIVEVQKLKAQIRGLEQNNEVDLCDIGEVIYAKYKDGVEVDKDVVVLCEEIKQRMETIAGLEKEVIDLKGQEACEGCGKPVDKTAAFCSSCGKKVEKEEPEREEPETEEGDEVEAPIFEEGDVVESIATEDEEIEIELVVEEIKEEVQE